MPDGFVFIPEENEWYVLEAELLIHGVWPHIAEQIVRFLVATQNPRTRKDIRNLLFEHISNANMINEVALKLETTPERLFQQIEFYIEGIDPQIAIFIDRTNQDLLDMVHALSSPTKVFQVRKFYYDRKQRYPDC